MFEESYRERNRTHEEIRQRGAIGNLNDGIEITTQGIVTRIIAWPGNGFQTESIHVLTVLPGQASAMYTYDASDEAMICLKGKGAVYLRGQWVDIEAGDLVYFPRGVEHGIRNASDSGKDFVLVNQICPPQFDLYADAGYFDKAHGVMNYDAIQKAKKEARIGNLSDENELHYNESHPDVRAWNLSVEEIKTGGALFNLYRGAVFHGIDVPMVLLLWPGYGIAHTGFHYGYMPPGSSAANHTHPVSDECIINWIGSGISVIGGDSYPTIQYDCTLAPCGVLHGGSIPADAPGPMFPGGFASPPQLDLYVRTPYYKDGKYEAPDFEKLETE